MPMNEYRKDDTSASSAAGRASPNGASRSPASPSTNPTRSGRYRRLPATPRKRIHVVTDRDGDAFQILSAKKPPSSEDA